MKKYLLILAALLLPSVALANFSVPWVGTSTTQGWVYPLPINGTYPTAIAPNFIATSTVVSQFPEATSTNFETTGTFFLGKGTLIDGGVSRIGLILTPNVLQPETWEVLRDGSGNIIMNAGTFGQPAALNTVSDFIPLNNGTNNLGTSSNFWKGLFVGSASTTITSATTLCLSTDCRTVWPSASVSGGTAAMITSWIDATTLTATSAPTAAYYLSTTTTPSQFPYASTTALSGTSLCLSTDCRSAWPAAGTYPFTPSTDGGIKTSATSTPIQGTNPGLGLDVSNTSWYGIGGNLFAYASSTNQDVLLGYLVGGGLATTSSSVGATLGNGMVAIGYRALNQVTTGGFNTAVGQNSMANTTTGNDNTAVGAGSLTSDTIGSSNTALGYTALTSEATGSQNTAAGYAALSGDLDGTAETAFGYAALLNPNHGMQNTALGYFAMSGLSSGSSTANTAVGYNSQLNNSVGIRNSSIGISSLQGNLTGSYNTAIGGFALDIGTSIASSTAIGYGSGHLSTGNNNIFVGTFAASSTTLGNNNIAIGYDIPLASTTGSNQLNIGNLIFATGVNGEGTNISTGNVGIGTTSPGTKLSIGGNVNISGGLTATTSTFIEATTTDFSATGVASTSQLLANNATSTTINSILATTTNFYGATLTSCNSASSALTWSAGLFGCHSISSASSTLLSDSNLFTGASSTIINFSAYNATTTFATTTDISVSNMASTSLFFANNATTTTINSILASSTSYYGGLLVSCTGGAKAVTWNAGSFGCQTVTGSGSASTTLLTDQNLFTGASTTILNLTTINSTSTFATSTTFATTKLFVNGINDSGYSYRSFTLATTTAWTGTSTGRFFTIGAGETVDAFRCATDLGTTTVNMSVNGGSNIFALASTTAGVQNPSFTLASAATTTVSAGNPTGSPTQVVCTLKTHLPSVSW